MSEHGKRLLTMNSVLGGATLSVFDEFAVDAPLKPHLDEETPTVLGFRAGQRIVIALLLDPETLKAHPTIELTLPRLAKVEDARLIDGVGSVRELTAAHSGRGLRVSVPVSSLPVATARGWGRKWDIAVGYVVIEM